MRTESRRRDSTPGFVAASGGERLACDPLNMPVAVWRAVREALSETNGLILIAAPADSAAMSTLAALRISRPDAIDLGYVDGREATARALETARRNLAFATIEEGDAIAALRRILALVVDPFSLARALRLVLAQRLVRRLCPKCRVPVQPPNAVTAPLGLDPGSVVYEARGCQSCAGSGFAGLAAVFEAIPVDDPVGRLIVGGGEPAAIANHAFRTWPNLAASVRALVSRGETTAGDAVQLIRDAQRQ